jgi:hypothetical protein
LTNASTTRASVADEVAEASGPVPRDQVSRQYLDLDTVGLRQLPAQRPESFFVPRDQHEIGPARRVAASKRNPDARRRALTSAAAINFSIAGLLHVGKPVLPGQTRHNDP